MALGAVLDACVLIPMSLCDTLLRAAQRNLYRPYWSASILAEVEKNLVKLGVDPSRAARRVAMMNGAFARADVIGYQEITDQMPNHPKDRHVLAAAVVAGAQTIVTFNLKDFRTAGTAQAQIQAEHPDEFLVNLYRYYPEQVREIITAQAAALIKSGRSWSEQDVLNSLDKQLCRRFAALLYPHFP